MDFPGISWSMNYICEIWNWKKGVLFIVLAFSHRSKTKVLVEFQLPRILGQRLVMTGLDFSMLIWKHSAHMWYYPNPKPWLIHTKEKSSRNRQCSLYWCMGFDSCIETVKKKVVRQSNFISHAFLICFNFFIYIHIFNCTLFTAGEQLKITCVLIF